MCLQDLAVEHRGGNRHRYPDSAKHGVRDIRDVTIRDVISGTSPAPANIASARHGGSEPVPDIRDIRDRASAYYDNEPAPNLRDIRDIVISGTVSDLRDIRDIASMASARQALVISPTQQRICPQHGADMSSLESESNGLASPGRQRATQR